MFAGGLLTKGIKAAYKSYRKAGGKKTNTIQRDRIAKNLKDHRKHGFRNFKRKHINKTTLDLYKIQSKEDVKQGIKMFLKKPSDKAKIKKSTEKTFGPTLKLVFKSVKEGFDRQKKYKKLN